MNLFKSWHWLSLAFISSMLFAAVHIYYALVYGIALLVQFTDLEAFGMAMVITYYLLSGNLLIHSVINGVYVATGFIGVASSWETGVLLRGSMILVGVIVAIALLGQEIIKKGDFAYTELVRN